jgi:hypothetical protein
MWIFKPNGQAQEHKSQLVSQRNDATIDGDAMVEWLTS